MIDLHVHTNYSDGTWDLKKLLEEAEKAKIEVLSITDHDTVKVYKELEKIDYKNKLETMWRLKIQSNNFFKTENPLRKL